MGKKILIEDDIQHGIAHRHGKRIAAIGGAVGAKRHAIGRAGSGEAGAERKAAANTLGHGHDVGLDTGPLVSKQLAGPADP